MHGLSLIISAVIIASVATFVKVPGNGFWGTDLRPPGFALLFDPGFHNFQPPPSF